MGGVGRGRRTRQSVATARRDRKSQTCYTRAAGPSARTAPSGSRRLIATLRLAAELLPQFCRKLPGNGTAWHSELEKGTTANMLKLVEHASSRYEFRRLIVRRSQVDVRAGRCALVRQRITQMSSHSGLYYKGCAGPRPACSHTPGRTDMQGNETELDLAAFVGLDWADQRHAVCLRAAEGKLSQHFSLEQTPETLHGWVSQLRVQFGGRKVAIAIEQSRGQVISALMTYDFLVLYPINPKALARYRQTFATSGSKDDPSDAELLLSLLLLHREKFRPWLPDDPQTRTLQMLVEHRRRVVQDRVRLTNRIKSLLKVYFPQALEWAGSLATLQACEFLERWPSLEKVKKAKASQFRNFYVKHGCRQIKIIEERIEQMRTAQALTQDPAVLTASMMMLQATVAPLRTVIQAVEQFDDQIALLFQQHPDHELYQSLPGAGAALEPRLLAAMGMDRARYGSAADIQQLSGTAPVTDRSGKKHFVYRRRACAKFMKQSFHEFAAHSVASSAWASAYYREHRDRGVSHHACVRALSFKWIRIIFRCWKDRKPYDERIYLESLRRRGSAYALALAPRE